MGPWKWDTLAGLLEAAFCLVLRNLDTTNQIYHTRTNTHTVWLSIVLADPSYLQFIMPHGTVHRVKSSDGPNRAECLMD